jgi:T5SS/PEP-CTERM-associated repeat protein
MQSKQLRPSVSTRGSTWALMALAGGVYFSMPKSVIAQDATWTGPGNEWTTGSNWTPATPTGTATFTNNGAPTAVNISGSATIDTMEFTAAAPAYSFNVTAGASFTVNTGITSASPTLPSFQVNLGSTLTFGDAAPDTFIGSLGDGTAGGGTIVIGPTDPSVFLTIAGGTSSTFSGSFSGAGSLELANTSTTLTLTGSSNGGNIGTIGGELILCDCYAGGLNISGGTLTVGGGFGVSVFGGALSVVNGGGLQINGNLGIASTMAISGAGSTVTVIDDTFVGGPAPATLTISNGGTLNSQRVAVIDGFFDTASVTVTGPGSTWNVGTDGLLVGEVGVGLLSIANGGQVNVSAAGMGIGDQGPGTSAVTVTGSGSALTTTGLVTLGDTGVAIGTLTAADGGVVSAAGGMTIGAGSTLNQIGRAHV